MLTIACVTTITFYFHSTQALNMVSNVNKPYKGTNICLLLLPSDYQTKEQIVSNRRRVKKTKKNPRPSRQHDVSDKQNQQNTNRHDSNVNRSEYCKKNWNTM